MIGGHSFSVLYRRMAPKLLLLEGFMAHAMRISGKQCYARFEGHHLQNMTHIHNEICSSVDEIAFESNLIHLLWLILSLNHGGTIQIGIVFQFDSSEVEEDIIVVARFLVGHL